MGSRVIRRYDPIGINDLTFEIKRSEENEGIIYNIVFDLEFIKSSRDFLKSCFEADGGIDSEVIVKIWQRNPNRRPRWSLYATGKVNWNRYELYEDRLLVAIEQTGFERSVLNLMDTQVDIETGVTNNGTEITPLVLPDLIYHSKKLLKTAELKPESGIEYQQEDVHVIIVEQSLFTSDQRVSMMSICQLNFDVPESEIEEIISQPYNFQVFPRVDEAFPINFPAQDRTEADYIDFLSNNLDLRSHNFEVKESGTIDIDISIGINAGAYSDQIGGDVDDHIGNFEVYLWLEHRTLDENGDQAIVSITNIGKLDISGHGEDIVSDPPEYQEFSYSLNDLPSVPGDKFYVYATFRVYGDWEKPNVPDGDATVFITHTVQMRADTFVKFTSKTVGEDVPVKTCLLHEAAERCAQFYTNQVDCFRSTLLGRTDILDSNGDPLYDEDGEASLLGITNGHFLRDREVYTTTEDDGLGGNVIKFHFKKLFISLKDILEFVNMRYCAGIGFEIINGKQYLVLEKKEYFFNKNLKISSLGQVYNVKKHLDSKRFWNEIEIGYSGKLDIGQTNAIDEFNTIRKFGIPIVNTKNKLKVTTKMRASGFQIEFQKRLRGTTKDSNLDDENFIVSLIRDGDTFKTKKDEGYVSITGVFDSPSGYNYDLSPARALQAWKRFIASCLTKSFDKTLKFTFGDGNYSMTSQKSGEGVISESGSVDLTGIQPDFEPYIYTIGRKFTADDITLVQNSLYGYEEFSDQFGEVMQGFILNIEHNPTEKMAELELLKVFRA
jgi:hypothetical protein